MMLQLWSNAFRGNSSRAAPGFVIMQRESGIVWNVFLLPARHVLLRPIFTKIYLFISNVIPRTMTSCSIVLFFIDFGSMTIRADCNRKILICRHINKSITRRASFRKENKHFQTEAMHIRFQNPVICCRRKTNEQKARDKVAEHVATGFVWSHNSFHRKRYLFVYSKLDTASTEGQLTFDLSWVPFNTIAIDSRRRLCPMSKLISRGTSTNHSPRFASIAALNFIQFHFSFSSLNISWWFFMFIIRHTYNVTLGVPSYQYWICVPRTLF